MVGVKEQYEAYPYPERDPKDEKKRLIQGSPSHPVEMDHFLWAGQRDWSRPLRVLVAGGGTGDGLIQLAALMTGAGRPYEITYIDLSSASRAIAEKRAKIRGLSNITFQNGDLLKAPELGEFDYIDCCGVLHHLPDPEEGFRALGRALAPEGGLGCMVYAPYGRSGVYPLQEAFGALLADLPPKEKLAKGREIFAALPAAHPFKRNPNLVDHNASDAGFYDLLLHSQDQAFTVGRLLDALDQADMKLAGFTQPSIYDPERIAGVSDALSDRARMETAERLDGTIKTHIAYAVKKSFEHKPAGTSPSAVPHLKGVSGRDLARVVDKTGQVAINFGTQKATLQIAKTSAPLLARIDGKTPLSQIAAQSGTDPIAFNAVWGPVSKLLAGWGILWYSNILKA